MAVDRRPVPFLHPKQNISLDALKCLSHAVAERL